MPQNGGRQRFRRSRISVVTTILRGGGLAGRGDATGGVLTAPSDIPLDELRPSFGFSYRLGRLTQHIMLRGLALVRVAQVASSEQPPRGSLAPPPERVEADRRAPRGGGRSQRAHGSPREWGARGSSRKEQKKKGVSWSKERSYVGLRPCFSTVKTTQCKTMETGTQVLIPPRASRVRAVGTNGRDET